MHVFFTSVLTQGMLGLDAGESKHFKALRLKTGDSVQVTDGSGRMGFATVENPDFRGALVNITRIEENYLARPYRLHIAISPTSHPDRFEWFAEKATEIGIDEITPLICSRSQKTSVQMRRIESICIAAIKQSGTATLPKINPATGFDTFIHEDHPGQLFIAHCEPGIKNPLINTAVKNRETTILIGPEGDFSPEEIRCAEKKSYIAVSLGDHRLRTETAGLYACQALQFINQSG